MKDDVLNNFISDMISQNMDDNMFIEHIDLFSKFLSYTNPSYKYNGTYLNQFVDDFIVVKQMLMRKHLYYHDIYNKLLGMGYDFELEIDETFVGHNVEGKKVQSCFAKIVKEKVVSRKMEIKVYIFSDDEYMFCKEYEDFECDNFSEKICNDIIDYINLKCGEGE